MSLQQNLLFKYQYTDGFSNRLLGIELAVGSEFHYLLKENALAKPDGHNESFFIEMKGLLPIKIKLLLKQIYAINDLENEIRADYTIDGFHRNDGIIMSITDLPSYVFLFFINEKTVRVDGDGIYLFNDSKKVVGNYQFTEAEKLLHQLWKELKNWTEYIYTNSITQQFS